MKRRNIIWSILLVGMLAGVVLPTILLGLMSARDANAVPAFARRYRMSCTTCHAPFPKLKAFGDEFAGNGFVIPEEEKERDYVSAGDDLLWLNRDFPVAVRFDAFGVYEDSGNTTNDAQTPWGVKLLSGGALYKNIGYYFYFYFSERGDVAGIEDAYVHFNDIFGTNVDIMVGQFQTSDPLMKRELRLTYEDYETYKTRIGNARTNLAYGRGVMLPFSIDETGTDIVAMVVNGNGLVDAGEDRKYDTDNAKNVGLRVSQAVGELLNVGGFVYYGKEKQDGVIDEVVYVGPDANLVIGPVEFTGQYLYRRDTNPIFLSSAVDVETNGVIAEMIFAPHGDRSRHYVTLLYNLIDSDLDAADYETATVSATYLLARNLRLIAEYTRDLEFEFNRVVIGFVSGF
ncbi:MAG: hypothetical protein JSW58_01715 [Candidatus Latescibacterota bacterium]|nr:MAG: hypothetical protein JSW58_01715 [Candidatus Latescibacterota bacterium]